MTKLSVGTLRKLRAGAGLGPLPSGERSAQDFPDKVSGPASAGLVTDLVEALGNQVLGEVVDLVRYAAVAADGQRRPGR